MEKNNYCYIVAFSKEFLFSMKTRFHKYFIKIVFLISKTKYYEKHKYMMSKTHLKE